MKTLDKYLIEYSNHIKIDNKIFAFRKKELFNITTIPTLINIKDNNGSKGYWINRKWYSLSKLKELHIKEPITIDVSNLQWYEQEKLNHVFNL